MNATKSVSSSSFPAPSSRSNHIFLTCASISFIVASYLTFFFFGLGEWVDAAIIGIKRFCFKPLVSESSILTSLLGVFGCIREDLALFLLDYSSSRA